MIECRPIRSEEGPAYLRVLCQVFDLDYARAESVFYHEPFFDLNRKWALFEEGVIQSVLTTVPLLFGDGPAMGIAGVGTLSDKRGRGFGQRLLEAALAAGEARAALFAQSTVLYERCGFEVLDNVVRAPFEPVDIDADAELVAFNEVRAQYDAWAARDHRRLLRDETRWGFWKWNLRMCAQIPGGYLCQEGNTIRECVFDRTPQKWPVFDQGEWFGLQCMLEELALPVGEANPELIFMGRGFTDTPRMFMTDQF